MAGGTKAVGGRGYAKQHFFKHMDMNELMTPSPDTPDIFTGAVASASCSYHILQVEQAAPAG